MKYYHANGIDKRKALISQYYSAGNLTFCCAFQNALSIAQYAPHAREPLRWCTQHTLYATCPTAASAGLAYSKGAHAFMRYVCYFFLGQEWQKMLRRAECHENDSDEEFISLFLVIIVDVERENLVKAHL
jgi:hypothetical protein